MYLNRFSAYLGEEQAGIFSRFFTADNLFLLVKMRGIEDKEELSDSFNFFFNQLLNTPINGLEDLDEFITKKIKELNLPLGLSLVCGFRKEGIFYLKAINGRIFIYRQGQLASLINGSQSASGYIEDNDLFVFTTASFMSLVKKEEELKKYLKENEANKITDRLAPELKPLDTQASIALFIQFLVSRENNFSPNNKEKLFVSKSNFFSNVRTSLANYWQRKFKSSSKFSEVSKNKKLTFIFVFLLLIILVWSVILGYGRRKRKANLKKIALVSQDINRKLAQAEEERLIDIQQAEKSITEAKKELKDLRKEVGVNFEKELSVISHSIQLKEDELVKKEDKKAEEFFDLALEDKNVQGQRLSLSKNKLAILATNGKIYFLNLDKKAVSKYPLNQLKTIDLFALYGEKTFFFSKKEGVFSLENGQLKKIITADENWQDIGAFAVYNRNLYFLDRGRANIYRYLVIENGYSNEQSYFKANSDLNFEGANSMAIDGSIYIGFKNRVIKYLSGKRQKFALSLPDKNFTLTKIYTKRNLDKVYLFDKTHGVVYQLTKDGDYEKEIRSESLKKTVDIIFYHQAAYFLVGSKILKINL